MVDNREAGEREAENASINRRPSDQTWSTDFGDRRQSVRLPVRMATPPRSAVRDPVGGRIQIHTRKAGGPEPPPAPEIAARDSRYLYSAPMAATGRAKPPRMVAMSFMKGMVRTLGSVEEGTMMLSPASTLRTFTKLDSAVPSAFRM